MILGDDCLTHCTHLLMMRNREEIMQEQSKYKKQLIYGPTDPTLYAMQCFRWNEPQLLNLRPIKNTRRVWYRQKKNNTQTHTHSQRSGVAWEMGWICFAKIKNINIYILYFPLAYEYYCIQCVCTSVVIVLIESTSIFVYFFLTISNSIVCIFFLALSTPGDRVRCDSICKL